MNTFFSIIIPLYNSAKTLTATLDSIKVQEFKKFEVVFVDGVSKDDTLKIISDFKAANPRIQTTVISEPDSGIYDAMNKGMAQAKGDWFYFMGGDDTLQSPQVLGSVCEATREGEPDLIYGNVSGAESHTIYRDDTDAKVYFRGIHHQGVFYKKRIFAYTGKYSLMYKIAADYHLTLKVFLNKAFVKKYADIDIAYFGEAGLSSQQHDWLFYSYHYKLLANNKVVTTINGDSLTCVNNSVYACFQLAQSKKNLQFAWQNLLFYTMGNNGLPLSVKYRNLFRMGFWMLRPKV